MAPDPELRIVQAENLDWLSRQPEGGFELIYVDPPFNTGREKRLRRVRSERDDEGGDHTGFGGKRYRTTFLEARATAGVSIRNVEIYAGYDHRQIGRVHLGGPTVGVAVRF